MTLSPASTRMLACIGALACTLTLRSNFSPGRRWVGASTAVTSASAPGFGMNGTESLCPPAAAANRRSVRLGRHGHGCDVSEIPACKHGSLDECIRAQEYYRCLVVCPHACECLAHISDLTRSRIARHRVGYVDEKYHGELVAAPHELHSCQRQDQAQCHYQPQDKRCGFPLPRGTRGGPAHPRHKRKQQEQGKEEWRRKSHGSAGSPLRR